MADCDMGGQTGEHFDRYLTGECAGRLCADVLCADHHVGSLDGRFDRLQAHKGRADYRRNGPLIPDVPSTTPRANSTADCGVVFIFQLPAITGVRIYLPLG